MKPGTVLAKTSSGVVWWDASGPAIRWCLRTESIVDASLWVQDIAAQWLEHRIYTHMHQQNAILAATPQVGKQGVVIKGTKLPLGIVGTICDIRCSKYRPDEPRVRFRIPASPDCFLPMHHIKVYQSERYLLSDEQICMVAHSNSRRFDSALFDIYAPCRCH